MFFTETFGDYKVQAWAFPRRWQMGLLSYPWSSWFALAALGSLQFHLWREYKGSFCFSINHFNPSAMVLLQRTWSETYDCSCCFNPICWSIRLGLRPVPWSHPSGCQWKRTLLTQGIHILPVQQQVHFLGTTLLHGIQHSACKRIHLACGEEQ